MTFSLPATHAAFKELTLVKADVVSVRIPGVAGGKGDELNVALLLAGEGEVRPVDNRDDAAIVRFNSPSRAVSYKYSFDPERTDHVVQPGIIADKEFSPLSPFTTWTLDFGVKDGLNTFIDLATVETVELRFTGHAFGRRIAAKAAAARAEVDAV